MVQIAGRYEVTESQNFKELLIKRGLPEDKAEAANNAKTVLKIIVDGKTVTLIPDEKSESFKHNLILDGEIEEKTPTGTTIKSFAKLEGNTIKVEITGSNGILEANITYNFSDAGLEIVYSSTTESFVSRRTYKRL